MEFLWDYNRASIAQKMSWAAGRDTLRIEGTAYCLMGLFGVNMPLLYGEGSQAFMRLQLEIMKISDDESLFAWASGHHLRHTSGLLANSPAAFRVSHSIRQTFPRRHEPYLMMNKGLQITLPLYQIEWKETPSDHPILPPPPDDPPFVYYLAQLNCHFHSTYVKQAVLVTLRAHQGTETYVRIECNKLEFEKPMLLESVTKPVSPDNNRQIFVYQVPQFLPLKRENFCLEVYTGPLLDREFIIRTGFGIYLQNVEHKAAVYARAWTFRTKTSGVLSIAVKGPRGTFALSVSYSTVFLRSRPQCPWIELLSAEQYELKLRSFGVDWYTGLVLVARPDRATLMLPCGDIVSATLKKTPRDGGIVYTLDFNYVSAKT
jgi:hypothetical protein